jgi:hypothetical protein
VLRSRRRDPRGQLYGFAHQILERVFLSNAIAPTCLIDWSGLMKFLGYGYRFLSNFVFLSMVYYSLNSVEKYSPRVVIAVLVLAYAGMRAATTMRSFYFFQRIERLELETRRLASQLGGGPGEVNARRLIVSGVSDLRRSGEMMSYIDLLFLTLIILLCVAKIVAD